MPRGKQAAERASAKEAAKWDNKPFALYFKLEDGDSTIVRFLVEGDDMAFAYKHEIPVPNRAWGRLVNCCDQEQEDEYCPGCEAELKLKSRGQIPLIWDDAPVLKRDSDGKAVKDKKGNYVIEGTEPQVALWDCSWQVFEDLQEKDTDFRGLMSRKFKIKRKGSSTDTTYTISPEDPDGGRQKMTARETKLMQGDTMIDIDEFIKPLTPDEMLVEMGEKAPGRSSSNGDDDASETKRPNPFMKRNRSKA